MELLPEPRTTRGAGTRHVQAQQSYLIGRYHWNKSGACGLVEAAAYFRRAVGFDPAFAAGHAALARTHVAAASYHLRPPREALEEARAAAAAALALDPADSEAHLSLAEVRKSLDWDPVGAEEEYRMAVACNPSNEAAQRLYGVFLAAHARNREATVALDRAVDLDPLCLVVNTSAAWVRYLTGDHAEAIERCQHTLDMDRGFVAARRQLAAALVGLGKIDEAITELEGAATPPRDPTSLAWLAHALAIKGDTHRATDIIGQLRRIAAQQYVSPFDIALALTGVGDLDGAFRALRDACDARDPAVADLAVEPRFEPLRGDRRYRELIDSLGLAGKAE
jgi:serine/threonine-protein kinase